ncbi:MAG: nucleoside kinase [Lachnospiraceae bacterium]|nr:nucleoside kinase [Lachnospiraceae bacterium]
MDRCRITINGETREIQKDTTFLEIAKEYQKDYPDQIMLVLKDGRLRELFKTVDEDCTLSFVTAKEDAGMKTYVRGMILVMLRAIYRVLKEKGIDKVRVEHAIGDALYCEIDGMFQLKKEDLEQVKQEMNSLVKRDLPFQKRSMDTEGAVKLFRHYGMYDKEKLFRYRRVSRANIYTLDGFEDYFYGYMPPSTSYLRYFDLKLYADGFLLMLPSRAEPKIVKPFEEKVKLFQTLQESNRWAATMGIDTVGALNEEITKGNMAELILVQEALQEKKIAEIAEQIKRAGNKKFIMIAGPSSSGKTTFSHRLSIQLRTIGYHPHPIAVDDYFVNRELTPKDENGNYNFETLKAIDVKQFNEDMAALLEGRTVELPSYNFKTGKREYKGNFKTLGKEDILVIEGIHGLNDELSYALPRESKFKIYISALTQLNIDEHNRIPTTDGRLIRRMVRDARTRGASARDTIRMWPSVRKGEEENIFPFQEDVDCMFNSALIYELAVLKQYAEPILFGIDKECEEYIEAKRLLKFLDYFLAAPSDMIPMNSILREFVGGSCFHV